jgi:hypothetical protein
MIRSLHGTLRKQQEEEETSQFSPPSDGEDKQAGTEAAI